MTKRLRPGKVLVDWSQNDAHKTTVTVYSVRARERPTVSTPVTWDEVARCREQRDERLLTFEVAERARSRRRPRATCSRRVLSLRQQLPAGEWIGYPPGWRRRSPGIGSDHAAKPTAGRHRDVEGDDRRAAAADASRRSRPTRSRASRSQLVDRLWESATRGDRARDRRPHLGPRPRPPRRRPGQAARRRVPRGARAADAPRRLISGGCESISAAGARHASVPSASGVASRAGLRPRGCAAARRRRRRRPRRASRARAGRRRASRGSRGSRAAARSTSRVRRLDDPPHLLVDQPLGRLRGLARRRAGTARIPSVGITAIGPIAWLIPQRPTIWRAIRVSCWMSDSAPVVDVAEHDLLGGAAAERDLDLREQVALVEVEAVGVGRREGDAERLPAGDDRDLAHRVGARA